MSSSSSSPPPSASSAKPPKPPKPLITPHENKRDLLLCSPAFGALFVDEDLCVVGGGGGGKKYELPNTLLLMRVSAQQRKNLVVSDGGSSSSSFGEIVDSLDFEEAGTIQTISDSCVIVGSPQSSAGGSASKICYFVVSHIDAFSLIKYSSSSSSSSHNKPSLKVVCRVALNTAALNADTKPVSIVNLSKEVGGPLIFAGQDNQTIAVFRLSTLLQWSDRETALKSTEVLPVAETIEDVKDLALSVCDFPTGGRLCDLRIKVVPTSLPENGTDICIAVAICTRDKTLLVGHFDQDDRKFIPSKKFTSEDFGFTKEFIATNVKNGKNLPFPPMFMGKSIRTCQFSPFPVNKIFAQDDAGKFVGVSTDLFVALQPLKMPVCAARISITSKKSSIETLSVEVEELVVASECSEAPATSTVLPVQALGDPRTRENAFCVATVEGSLIEFLFSSSAMGVVRRIVSGFHFDAVTSIALAPNHQSKDSLNRLIISTDIARRIAFHTFDPRNRTTSTATVESMEKVKQPPNLFTNELTSAALSKKRKKTLVRFVVFSILILIVALLINFVMGYLF